jgi:hypothetical protein
MHQLAKLVLFALTMMVVSIGFVPGGVNAQRAGTTDPWMFR